MSRRRGVRVPWGHSCESGSVGTCPSKSLRTFYIASPGAAAPDALRRVRRGRRRMSEAPNPRQVPVPVRRCRIRGGRLCFPGSSHAHSQDLPTQWQPEPLSTASRLSLGSQGHCHFPLCLLPVWRPGSGRTGTLRPLRCLRAVRRAAAGTPSPRLTPRVPSLILVSGVNGPRFPSW